ncbi:peptidylprolyl isomerase [Moorena sp. SIO4G3]|uniref:peptidylprolyl isomerase n=1 Tax=Moorena sp. SIO4G3 TaxID=2607821 RepID=UPI00142C1EC1|nr:peptidylprolyl isomerase [Moorena sp. SIO4G3]NEO75131.1 peptidylprolyl isomerase [Moorena sp. SIO4G3]
MSMNIRRWLSVMLVVLGLVIAGCSSPTPNSTESSTPQNKSTPAETTSNPQFSNLPRLDKKATVELRVKGSPITIEVYGSNAPITAGNFVDLVDKGVYDGLVFHRVVREPQPFVVQGGDPQGKNPKFPVELLGTGGFIDPQTNETRYIPLEIKPKGAKEPIYSKTFKAAGIPGDPQLTHTRGAVAMARSQMPNSASSQFYFALAELPFLDGNYAVFGKVIKGMDVVDKIQQGDRIESVKVTQGIENLKKP